MDGMRKAGDLYGDDREDCIMIYLHTIYIYSLSSCLEALIQTLSQPKRPTLLFNDYKPPAEFLIAPLPCHTP